MSRDTGFACRFAVAAIVAGCVLGVVGSSAWGAEEPWWHLVSTSAPSSVQPGQARNEVQRLTVSATKGDVFIANGRQREAIANGEQASNYAHINVPYNITAGQLQEQLEKYVFPADKVVVTGGPGDEKGTKYYEITFPAQSVSPIFVSGSEAASFGGEALSCEGASGSGCTGEASVAVVSNGRPDAEIVLTAANLGDGDASPQLQPIVVAGRLPAGLEAVSVEASVDEDLSEFGTKAPPLECSLATVSCTYDGSAPPGAEEPGDYPLFVAPYQTIRMLVGVRVRESARSGEVSEASISGGGAPAASVSSPLTLGAGAPRFGVDAYELRPEDLGGGLDTQAGSHPFQLTATIDLNNTIANLHGMNVILPAGLAKDLHFKLPPGLVGDPTPFPRCTLRQFLTSLAGHPSSNECPASSVIGVSRSLILLHEGTGRYPVPFLVPVYNLETAVGEPARFGFIVEGVPVYLDTAVRTGGDYGVTVNVSNITQEVEFLGNEVTLWGVPGDARHDNARGGDCLEANEYDEEGRSYGAPACEPLSEFSPPSLLSLPTACTGALQSVVEADSWAEPHDVLPFGSTEAMPALDGCNRLPFGSSISVAPDGQQGSTPTGLTVGIHIPQEDTLTAEGLSEAAVRDTTVTLPEGVQISSAGAGGLLACSEEQVGFTGVEEPGGTLLYTPGVVGCPDASKVATAEIKTPLLPEPLVGAAYLATQNANPFGSLIGLYVYAEDPVAGVKVKLAGEVRLNEVTGQIVTVFPDSPQVPFEEAKLHFFGGDRAPLSTPPLCGSYTSTASIVPWSGNEPSKSSSKFEITSGPNGEPCEDPRPFQPGFNAGTTSIQAGGYSPLTMTMTRPDADQALGKLSVVFPPGISAGLQGVRLCEEPQATSGQCPAESQIGTVTASTGFGGDPFPVETGKAYITGPYEGDPFGVDVVVPAVAGPFNLGTEVVRSKVDVDPTDAHLTVVSDAFPTMLDGIPLQLQHINVDVNRPGFVFNPTSCEPMELTGVLESSEGATANVANPFQVTNCAALTFKPEFKVQTSAKTSRTEGASLHVTLTLPDTPRGTGANVAKVKVSLPKQLPSPLKTLQKACTEKVFAENPSNCPKASRVGEATVQTPVLEGPLSGPAYFVSHGGAKYPELIIVLVGEDGVTVQVHGETFISKAGITTATFATVPDVPFSNFELELPEREYPALTANGNLCKGTLLMPTEMVGQNGLKLNQETKISVTGCPKAKKVSHKKKGKGGHAKRRRAGHKKQKG